MLEELFFAVAFQTLMMMTSVSNVSRKRKKETGPTVVRVLQHLAERARARIIASSLIIDQHHNRLVCVASQAVAEKENLSLQIKLTRALTEQRADPLRPGLVCVVASCVSILASPHRACRTAKHVLFLWVACLCLCW